MPCQPILQFTILAISTFVLVCTIVYCSAPKARFYLLFALAIFFYSFGFLFELTASSLEAAFLGKQLGNCGFAYVSVFFYLFIRDYRNRAPGSRVFVLLLLFPLFFIILANTYPANTLYYQQLTYYEQPRPHIALEPGLFFYLQIAYSHFFCAASIYEVYRYYPRVNREERCNFLIFLAAAVLPQLTSLYLFIARNPQAWQLHINTYVLLSLVLGAYIIRYRPQDWLPSARQHVLENIHDGFILLDAQQHLLEANRAAISYFPALAQVQPGTPLQEIPDLARQLGRQGEHWPVLELPEGGQTRYLQTSQTPIQYRNKTVCTCFFFYDISEQRRLFEELQRLAMYDELTGMLNRNSFMQAAERDFHLHRRNQTPATLLMMDIDHFKLFNDNYGHLCGDKVLKLVAKTVRPRLRSTDLCGRYGGDEFCIFLPNTEQSGAATLAREICRDVESKSLRHNEHLVQVQTSIGIAQLNLQKHQHLEDLIAAADVALYQAKQNGRNCCAGVGS